MIALGCLFFIAIVYAIAVGESNRRSINLKYANVMDRLAELYDDLRLKLAELQKKFDDFAISTTNRITEEKAGVMERIYFINTHFNDLSLHIKLQGEEQDTIDTDLRHALVELEQRLDALSKPNFHQILADALVAQKHFTAKQKAELHKIILEKRNAKKSPRQPEEIHVPTVNYTIADFSTEV